MDGDDRSKWVDIYSIQELPHVLIFSLYFQAPGYSHLYFCLKVSSVTSIPRTCASLTICSSESGFTTCWWALRYSFFHSLTVRSEICENDREFITIFSTLHWVWHNRKCYPLVSQFMTEYKSVKWNTHKSIHTHSWERERERLTFCIRFTKRVFPISFFTCSLITLRQSSWLLSFLLIRSFELRLLNASHT